MVVSKGSVEQRAVGRASITPLLLESDYAAEALGQHYLTDIRPTGTEY